MNYGIMTEVDANSLEKILVGAYKIFPSNLKVLEIGVCHGGTARGIKDFLDTNKISFTYYGIDNQRDKKIVPPFDGANLILGESGEVYNEVPNNLHVVFIDGCHCVNHVMLDFLHYSNKLAVGGFVLFHDTSPLVQGMAPQHGPSKCTDFSIAILKAIELLKLENRTDWVKVYEDYDLNRTDFGGIQAYKRLK